MSKKENRFQTHKVQNWCLEGLSEIAIGLALVGYGWGVMFLSSIPGAVVNLLYIDGACQFYDPL